MTQPQAIDPIHTLSAPDTRWSRINAEEAFPGVSKPLCWDFFGAGTNRSWRGTVIDFGLLREGEHLTGDADIAYLFPFYGRSSINLDRMMTVMGLFPGNTADQHAKELFSDESADSGVCTGNAPSIDRAKFERHKARLRGIVIAEHEELYQWWRAQTTPQILADTSNSTARYFEALARHESAQKNHPANSTLCQQAFSAAGRLAADLGEPALASKLTTGFGDTIDTRKGRTVADKPQENDHAGISRDQWLSMLIRRRYLGAELARKSAVVGGACRNLRQDGRSRLVLNIGA